MRIWVTFRREAFHRWPDAPERRAYLSQAHRHMFHVKLTTEVAHSDRQIEFHDLLDMARGLFDTGDGTWSCERMAGNLAEIMATNLDRWVSVEVSEDGECGAVVEAQKKPPPVSQRGPVGWGK